MEKQAVKLLNLAHRIKQEIDARLEDKDFKVEMVQPKLIDWVVLRYLIEPVFSRVNTLQHMTVQKNLNTIEFIGALNRRGNLFAYFNLHDTVVMLQKRLQASDDLCAFQNERLQKLELKVHELTFKNQRN